MAAYEKAKENPERALVGRNLPVARGNEGHEVFVGAPHVSQAGDRRQRR
jgi:hypothetical protein